MTGRSTHDHRRMPNGMLWILRTGAPWIDLPARYGPTGMVSSRSVADARGAIDWSPHFVDASVIRAHRHAAYARRTGANGG